MNNAPPSDHERCSRSHRACVRRPAGASDCLRCFSAFIASRHDVPSLISTRDAGCFFFPILNGGELAVLYSFVFLYLAAAGGGPWSF